MNFGVIGSGKVGSALGAWAARCGAQVAFASRRDESARAAARNAGGSARADSLAAVVHASELVLLALPFAEVQGALEPVRAQLRGKVLLDATNPITADHRDLTIGHTDSGAERIARAFPEARVVKAFNHIFADVYAARSARIGDQRLTLFYAGDDTRAKTTTEELVVRLGFDPVDVGPLSMSRFLEPLSLLNIHLGKELGWGTHIGLSMARVGGSPQRGGGA